jgi:uncharacterized protein YqgC (DUF456 family)
MAATDLLTGLAIAIGLVGIVVPVLPGSVLVLVAILVWAVLTSTAIGWTTFAVATLLLAVGAVVKYAVPGRRLKADGVPNRSLFAGAALGVVGFFVVPVVGLLIGFVLGVYLAELQRVGRRLASPTTRSALRAVGASILIELGAGMLAALTWLVGAIVV